MVLVTMGDVSQLQLEYDGHVCRKEKFVGALRDALHKVELISTSCNGDGNKNVACDVCGRVCYTGQLFVHATCLATKFATQVSGKKWLA